MARPRPSHQRSCMKPSASRWTWASMTMRERSLRGRRDSVRPLAPHGRAGATEGARCRLGTQDRCGADARRRSARAASDPQQRRSDVRRASRRRQFDDRRLDRGHLQADGPRGLHLQGLPFTHSRRAHQLRDPGRRAAGLRHGGQRRRAGRLRPRSGPGAHRGDAAGRLRRLRQHLRDDSGRPAPGRPQLVRDPARSARQRRRRARAGAQHHLARRAGRADRHGPRDRARRRARRVRSQGRQGRRPQHAGHRRGRETTSPSTSPAGPAATACARATTATG